MPNFREYNDKLKSASGMRRVTATMKMVSSSHLRRAQKDLHRSDDFTSHLATLLEMVQQKPSLRKNLFLAEPPPSTPPSILLIVISADRGLCGSYNNAVIHAAEQWAETARKERGASVRAVYVGQKAHAALQTKIPTRFNLVASDAHPTLRHTHVLSSYALLQFLDHKVSEVWVLFTRYLSTMKYEPTTARILPLDPNTINLFTADAPKPTPMPRKPILEPGLEALLETVARQWVDLALFKAEAHSVTSEHASRMVSMDSATKNLDSLSKQLRILRNRARQAAITKELTDIVGGAESLKD